MAQRRRSARLAGVIAAFGLAGTLLTHGQTAMAASCLAGQPQLAQVPGGGQAQPLAGSVPVVFVHGMDSSAGVWDAQSPASLARQVAGLRGITAWTFDYGRESLDWVSNRAIGPSLATSISCLAQLTGSEVLIVAHSMGGLAAQYAIGGSAGHVAEVITIGTPYDGSQILTIGERAINDARWDVVNPSVAFTEAWLSYCAGVATHTGTNPCWLASVLRAPAGTALETNSPQIQALPSWPDSLPVFDIAGNMSVRIGVGRLAFQAHPGDGAVTLPSATAHNTAGNAYVVSCAAGMFGFWRAPCFHTSLPGNPAVGAAVISAIRGFQPAAPGVYRINRQIANASPWVLTLTEIRIGAEGQARFIIRYANTGSASAQLTCNGDTDPSIATVTLSSGQTVAAKATYCSAHPNQAVINVPAGQSLMSYGIFPDTQLLSQPFTFDWSAGSLSGEVTGIQLPR